MAIISFTLEGNAMDDQKTSTTGIIALVLSIIALLLSAVPIINNFAFVLAVLGLILGVLAYRKVKKGKRTGRKIAIIAMVLSLIAGAVVLLSQKFYVDTIDEATKSANETIDKATGESTDELLKDSVTVVVGAFSATKDQYGLDTTSLPVTVTNKLAESKSYTIQVEAVDAAGKRLAEDSAYANDLGAKQTQDFTIFKYVESDKVEALKTATFKVMKVSQY